MVNPMHEGDSTERVEVIPDAVVDPLFRDRHPESAARQLATVLVHATECHLATLEMLECRKNASASDKRRQKLICDTLVFHCADLNVNPRFGFGHPAPRLTERIALAKTASVIDPQRASQIK